MSLAIWLTVLSYCSSISSMAVNTSPAMTLIPITNFTGSSSDLLLGVSDVQKAPEPTDPLSFIIGGPLPSNLSANVGEVGVTYTCNAGLYGRPNAASCLQALLDIPGNNREITFGNRTAGQAWNIPLPFRFISRKSMLTTTEKAKSLLIMSKANEPQGMAHAPSSLIRLRKVP